MKKITLLFSLAILCIIVFSMQSAKADSQRMMLLEGFTNSGCGPCAQTWPTVDPIMESHYDVAIPIKFHFYYPDDLDPMYLNNVPMSNARFGYYGINGVPHLVANGTISGHPGNINTLIPDFEALKGVMSPITLTITESKTGTTSNVKVKVASSTAISGSSLKIYIVEYKVLFTGSNGEPVHNWVAREVLPNSNGTPLTVVSGGSQEVNVSYTPKSTYAASQLYVVAFVQNDNSKEVLQAGTNLMSKLIKADISLDGTKFNKMGRNTSFEKIIKVNNPNSVKADFDISVSNGLSVFSNECTVALDVTSVSLDPGETKNVKVTITSNDEAFFANINVKAIPKATGKIPDPDSLNFYMLTQDAKMACYGGLGANTYFAYLAMESSATYKKDVVYILLYETGILTEYNPNQFDLATFGVDYSNTSTVADASGIGLTMLTAIESMLDAGKRVFYTHELGAFLSFSGQTTSTALKFLLQDNLGIIGAVPHQRVQTDNEGYITGVVEYKIRGVSSDAIGTKIGSITCNQYENPAHPYYIVYTDSLVLADDAVGKPFVYTDNNTNSISGVRAEVGESARIAYMSFGLEAIKTTTVRNTVALAIIDWLMSDVSSEPKAKFNTDYIDLGKVKKGTSAYGSFTIENKGAKQLKISEISIDGDEEFEITSGNTDIPSLNLGDKHTVNFSFTPTEDGVDYDANIRIVSNSIINNDYYVVIVGSGIGDVLIPEIKINTTSVDFDSVAIDSVKYDTLQITNIGTGELIIDEISWDTNDGLVYSIAKGDEGLPEIKVLPTATHKLIISLSSWNAGTYNGKLYIQTNDESNPAINVTYIGKVFDPSSVAETSDKSVKIEVLPNPIVSNGTIKLDVNDDGYKSVSLSLVDATGKKVADLFNGEYTLGKYDVTIDASKFAAGSYTILAIINGETVTVPFIIAK